jgi:hypothetical protein
VVNQIVEVVEQCPDIEFLELCKNAIEGIRQGDELAGHGRHVGKLRLPGRLRRGEAIGIDVRPLEVCSPGDQI